LHQPPALLREIASNLRAINGSSVNSAKD